MIAAAKRFLERPFPYDTSVSNKWKIAFAFGLFISLFLIIFAPFGLHDVQVYLRATYGIVTFLGYAILNIGLPFLFPRCFDSVSWTVKREFVLTVFNFLVIGFLNLLNSVFFLNFELSWNSILQSELYTFSVGIFPVLVTIMYRELSLRHRFEKNSIEINSEMKPANEQFLASTNESLFFEWEEVKIPFHQLLFFQSSGNYADLFYLQEDKVLKIVLRVTLKMIELQLPETFLRCHKSYIVNLHAVERSSGNAQGLKLHISNTTLFVPVSRQSIEITKNRLQQRSN